MWVIALWTVGAAWAEGCEEPQTLVGQLETSLLEGRFEDTEALLDRTVAALGCAGPADPQLLARMWQTEGALHHFEGREVEATQSFAAAHRTDPSAWSADLGDALRARYDAAKSQAQPGSTGEVQLKPERADLSGYLNGAPTAFPTIAPAGVHLLQLIGEDEHGRFARPIQVGTDQTLVVNTDQLRDLTEGGAYLRRPFPTWLVIAGSSAALAGTTAYLSTTENAAMEAAEDRSSLDAALTRQSIYAWSTYGLGGLAITGATLHFVL